MKKSSYQKLKEENARLRDDLRSIVMHPDEYRGIERRSFWTIQFEVADQIWRGSRENSNTTDGLAKLIS